MKPALLILLLLCGCATHTPRVVESMDAQYPAPEPKYDYAEEFAGIKSMPSLQPPAQIYPVYTKSMQLAWSNRNSQDDFPALLCDIHSTTNILQSFRPRFLVNVWPSNSVAFYATNSQEFFIARFFDPVTWQYSEWNTK